MPVYQLHAEFDATAPEGPSPSFPYMEGWTLVKVSLDGPRSTAAFEGSEGVPKAMEALFAALEEAAKRGEVKEGYDVKLFANDVAQPAAAAPAASKAKKSRWAGLF